MSTNSPASDHPRAWTNVRSSPSCCQCVERRCSFWRRSPPGAPSQWSFACSLSPLRSVRLLAANVFTAAKLHERRDDRFPHAPPILERTHSGAGPDRFWYVLTVAQKRGPDAYLMVLLGGDAGMRLEEYDRLARRGSADTAAHGTAVRLARARDGAERRSDSSSPDDTAVDGGPQTGAASAIGSRAVSAGRCADHARPRDQSDPKCATRRGRQRGGRSRAAAHVLFASRDEGRTRSCDSRLGRTRGSHDDAALYAPESGGD